MTDGTNEWERKRERGAVCGVVWCGTAVTSERHEGPLMKKGDGRRLGNDDAHSGTLPVKAASEE
jgi:hypothetical protein